MASDDKLSTRLPLHSNALDFAKEVVRGSRIWSSSA